jgi:hypothetical protein
VQLPLLATLVLSAAPTAPAGGELQALRERATAAYQKKRYAEACPLFEQVTRQVPMEGEAWSDLALCRFRLKQRDAAVAAAAKALQYGERQTRLSTYYNLGKFTGGEYGGAQKAGGDDDCWPVSPVPGCERTVWRCDHFQSAGGAMVDGSAQWTLLGWTREQARQSSAARLDTGESSSFRSFGTYDWREVEIRKKEIELGLAELPKDTGRTCTIVWLDVCACRAGLFCEGYEVDAGASEKERVKATKRTTEEVSFTMPSLPAQPQKP